MSDFPNCSGNCPCRCKTEPISNQDPGDETTYTTIVDGAGPAVTEIPESGDKVWGMGDPTLFDFTGEVLIEEVVYPRHPSSQAFHDRVDGYKEMHDRKQADYGSDTDPFANVRNGARKLGLPGWVGAVIRMNDKIERLNKAAKQYIETGEISLANEGVLDSFDDLAVYSGIGAVLFQEES